MCRRTALILLANFTLQLAMIESSAEPGPQVTLRKKNHRLTETRVVLTPEYVFHQKPKERRLWPWPIRSKHYSYADGPVLDLPVVLSKELIIKATPRPTFSQHSSTLVEVLPGELLAAWFGGSWEKNSDVGIWMSRYKDGVWSDVPWQVIPPERESSVWNPVLFKVPATKEVLLFYKVGKDPESWKGCLVRSRDNGKTWSNPDLLPPGIFGPAKNKPVLLADGTILAGSSDEVSWTVHSEYSTDSGRTWKRTPPIPFKGRLLQPALFVDGTGYPRMLCRSYGERVRKRFVDNNAVLITSDKSGHHWGAGERTNLPNPNSGLDVVRLTDGRLLAAYNPNNDGGQRSRASLAIAVSRDEGRTWRMIGQLERVEKAPRPWLWPEFSYPSVIQSALNGTVHVTYTYTHEVQRRSLEGRENVMHVALNIMDLTVDN